MLQNIIGGKSDTDAETSEVTDYVQNLLVSNLNATALGQCPMEELELKYDKNNVKDISELRNILSINLSYPSTQIAETHLRANRLGTLDLKAEQGGQNSQIINENAKFCPCCGFIEQLNTLSIMTSLKHVTHIGVSTFFYFFTLFHLLLLLLIMFIFFSGYAMITNIQASNMYRNSLNGTSVTDLAETYSGFLAASLGSKGVYYTQFGNHAFNVQCWLGVVLMIIWGFLFVLIEYRERQAEHFVDYQSKTAGDYTLVFENMPKDMTISQLQTQLNQYLNLIRKTYNSHLSQKDIRISKINQAIPFYLDESTFDDKQLDKINKQHDKCKNSFIDWIEGRQKSSQFSISEQERQLIYTQFNNLNDQKIELLKKLTDQIIEKKKQKKRFIETVPTFVTFKSSYNKQFLQKMHDGQNYRWLFKLPCFDRRDYYHYTLNSSNRSKLAQIKPAPEPQDIIWTNLGQSECSMMRKRLMSFGVSLVILSLSFCIVWFLGSLNEQLSSNSLSNKNTFKYLSLLISLCITGINTILNQILWFLTVLQRNQTFTQQQTSLGLKAAIFVLLNSILIPILVNQFFKFNLYGTNGLSDDVFFLAITKSFVPPLMKIFDGYYFFTRIMKWYYNRPNSKLSLDQSELNSKSEYIEFEIGYEYIYVVNLFLFTCFFVSLQPIIPIFAMCGLCFMQFAQKYSLFNRCKRPTPGNSIVNTAMFQLIYTGPLLYSFGSLCWSNFLGNLQSGQTPNIVALIISIIILIVPYREIVKAIKNQQVQPQQLFEKNRIFLPSQYDRLNPITSKQGINNYMDFVVDYQKNLKNKTPEQIKALQNIFVNQYGVSHRKNEDLVPTFSKLFHRGRFNSNLKNQNLFKQLLGGTTNNSMNPLLIGQAVIQNHKSKMNSNVRKPPMEMAVQNWLTHEQAAKGGYGYSKNTNNPLAILMSNVKNNPQWSPKGNNQNNYGNQLNPNNQNVQSNQMLPELALNLFGGMFPQNSARRRGGHRSQGNRNRNREQRHY